MEVNSTVSVLVPRPFDRAFDYLVPEGMELRAGDYVRVPFGSQDVYGVVWGEPVAEAKSADFALQSPEALGSLRETAAQRRSNQKVKLKAIAAKVDHLPPMSEAMRGFVDWVAWYTLAAKGNVLKMAMSVEEALHPISARQRKGNLESGIWNLESRNLNPKQAEAAKLLSEKLDAGFTVSVLDGVTGSGKTEVYFDTIARLLEKADSQILILLPEIALSVQWLTRFEQRFGAVPHLWHSGVTPARKRETWRAIARGEARVVVGARSALFLPFQNLQLIVVDEEHEHSYKQEDGVMYQARDMAVARAQREQCPIVLASATPSLETVVNTEQGKYQLLHLPHRHGGATLPEVELVDMRQHKPRAEHWVSEPLRAALERTLEAGQQAMLFINRRGFAPLVLCKSCGHRFGCPHCDAWLVEHKHPPRLQCHHCDYRTPPPAHCPECGVADGMHPIGPGVERLAAEAAELFPQAQIGLMTSDSLPSAQAVEHLIEAVERGGVNLLIGTQMMAKGHHFPNLALVGVVDADMGLMGGDLRASERSWQLLHQLAGRAGREQIKGKVMVQTYQPDHAVMQALLHHDRENFIAAEKHGREQAGMPPFGRLAALILEGKDEAEVQTAARLLAKEIPAYRGMQLFGPAPAPLSILRGKYRYRLLLKTAREVNLPRLLREWLEPIKLPKNVRVKVDVDPYSFM